MASGSQSKQRATSFSHWRPHDPELLFVSVEQCCLFCCANILLALEGERENWWLLLFCLFMLFYLQGFVGWVISEVGLCSSSQWRKKKNTDKQQKPYQSGTAASRTRKLCHRLKKITSIEISHCGFVCFTTAHPGEHWMRLYRPAATSQGTRFMFCLCVHVYMNRNDLGKKFTTQREHFCTQISNFVCRLKSSMERETLCFILLH